MNWDALAEALARVVGSPVGRDTPLADYSTYRLGGPAAVLVEPGSVDELVALGVVLGEAGADVPLLVVGKGSNLLVSDDGFPGVALHLVSEFEQLAVTPDGAEPGVAAGAAVPLPVLARRAAAAGCAGIEFYVGIPGTVGGAVRMNAGGHGRETAEVLVRAFAVDLRAGAPGGERELTPEALEFGYRSSSVRPGQVVTRAEFRCHADDPGACGERIDEIVRWRRENQPGGANAGSVFTNPPGDSAGRLIDACGLKGHRVGGAVVSPKHANFFQAEDGATAADVARLVAEVRSRVEAETGVVLHPELTLVGFPSQ